MKVEVNFFSYFRELTGCSQVEIELPQGSTIVMLLEKLYSLYPKLSPLGNSTLIAVGVEYAGKSHVLRELDKVSLFPPVQGG